MNIQQVATIFQEQLADDPGGAALCVISDDSLLDLHGGWAIPAGDAPGRRWTPDTLADLASATKAMPATALLHLVDRGRIGLDDRVADHWRAYGCAGKESTSVRQLLAHQAGVVTTTRPITPADAHAHDPIVAMLAAQTPDWEPGTAHGYHGVTFGWLISGLVQAVTGKTVFDYFDQEIAAPREIDAHMRVARDDLDRLATSLPPTEEQIARGMDDPRYAEFNAALVDPSSLAFRATFGALAISFDEANSIEVLTMPDPSGGGHATARGLAELYASLGGIGDRQPLIAPMLLNEARHVHSRGHDRVLGIETIWGLGFMLPNQLMWQSSIPGALGHGGASGSLAFLDPENRIAFAYTPSAWRGLSEGDDPRASELVTALYSAG